MTQFTSQFKILQLTHAVYTLIVNFEETIIWQVHFIVYSLLTIGVNHLSISV